MYHPNKCPNVLKEAFASKFLDMQHYLLTLNQNDRTLNVEIHSSI